MCALLALAGPPSEIAICTHTTRAGSCEIDIMEEASTCSPFYSISFMYSASGFPMHSLKDSRVARRDSTSELLSGSCWDPTRSEPRVNVHVRSQ